MQMDFVDCVDREDLEPWKELTSGKLFPRYSFYFKNMVNIFWQFDGDGQYIINHLPKYFLLKRNVHEWEQVILSAFQQWYKEQSPLVAGKLLRERRVVIWIEIKLFFTFHLFWKDFLGLPKIIWTINLPTYAFQESKELFATWSWRPWRRTLG